MNPTVLPETAGGQANGGGAASDRRRRFRKSASPASSFSFGLQASLMSLGTLVSRLLGFARDLSIAAFFSRTQTDVFFAAFRLPNFCRRFLGEGAFSASVTPTLAETLQHQGRAAAARNSAAFFTLFASTAGALSLSGVIFMEDIMNLFFKDAPYADVKGKLQQTVVAGRIVFSYLFLTALYSYFLSAAHALGKFFLPALAPALFNVSLIVFAFLPQNLWPFPAFALSWAAVLGGAAQAALAYAVLSRSDFAPVFSWRRLLSLWPETVSVLKRFVPASIGLAGLALIGLMNLYFAGQLAEGAHTYLYYGDRLLELPRSLIAVSLGSALVPELSRFFAKGDRKSFFAAFAHSLDFLLFLILPCALVFFLLSEPIVSLLFERGRFQRESVEQTAAVLKISSLTLLFASLARVFASGFFAANKNVICAVCSLLYALFHYGAGSVLTEARGLPGLVFATALSSGVYCLFLAAGFQFFIGSADWMQRAAGLARALPGLLFLALILSAQGLAFRFFLWADCGEAWALALSVFLILLAGGIGFLASGLFFKHPAAAETLALLRRSLPKKTRSR